MEAWNIQIIVGHCTLGSIYVALCEDGLTKDEINNKPYVV